MEELRKRSGRLTDEEKETLETNENEQEILTEKDDEELWDENEKIAEVRIGSKPKRREVLRRSVAETGLALLVHFVLLMFYIALHVHDATMVKRCPDPEKYFAGINTYAGRMKYFTHQTMWVVGVYFFLAFFADVMPLSQAKQWLRQFNDWYFTTVVWIVSWVCVLFFWALYFKDRELIYPDFLEKYIPANSALNHGWHTFPVVAVIIESVLVFHHYPSNIVVGFTTLAVASGYTIWILVIYSKTQKWLYPFMKSFTPITFALFVLFSFFASLVFCGIGKLISYLRWKDRFQAIYEMQEESYIAVDDEDED